MKKGKIRKRLDKAKSGMKVANIYLNYDRHYYNAIPLAIGESLVLSVLEDDFILDGYAVFRIKDITKIKVKNDLCNKIISDIGLLNEINPPNIDIQNWRVVFESIISMNINIIIEAKTQLGNDYDFYIGKVIKAGKNTAVFRHFDANGIWQSEPYKIPYSEIFNIKLLDRYSTVFSKYVSAPTYPAY
ncbi:MAG: hypothetical protein FWG90_00865 [Oscillospiraceae bacterium]|nr:hypothetical protein [Oscillospiraceae bacterium]